MSPLLVTSLVHIRLVSVPSGSAVNTAWDSVPCFQRGLHDASAFPRPLSPGIWFSPRRATPTRGLPAEVSHAGLSKSEYVVSRGSVSGTPAFVSPDGLLHGPSIDVSKKTSPLVRLDK